MSRTRHQTEFFEPRNTLPTHTPIQAREGVQRRLMNQNYTVSRAFEKCIKIRSAEREKKDDIYIAIIFNNSSFSSDKLKLLSVE